MSYQNDSVYRTIRWLHSEGPGSFAAAFAEAMRDAGREVGEVKVRLGRMEYKPFKEAHVMAQANFVSAGAPPVTVDLLLTISSDARAAEREFETSKRQERRDGFGPSAFLLTDRNLVAWTLPNGPALHEVRELLVPEMLDSVLTMAGLAGQKPTLTRYDPMKRAVLTCVGNKDRQGYRLVVTEGWAAATAALNLRQISAWAEHGALDFAVSHYIRYTPALRTLIMSELPGSRFIKLMPQYNPRQFAEIGLALASLHNLPAAPEDLWTSETELAGLASDMDDVKLALPEVGGRLDALIERLDEPPAGCASECVPIHGALCGDQIIYDFEEQSGHRIGLVDWDSLRAGDPHYDLGRLIAHVLYVARLAKFEDRSVQACIEAMLQAYGRACAWRIDPAALRWPIRPQLPQGAECHAPQQRDRHLPSHIEIMIAEAERLFNLQRVVKRPPARIAENSAATAVG